MNSVTPDQETNAPIDKTALAYAAGRMLGVPVLRADCRITPLHGGTLGNVRLLAGSAETGDGRSLPCRIVLKTQKRWERPGDPDSWRREYDLYQSDFGEVFTDSFRWPLCWHAEISENETQVWMEHIEGRSGAKLALEDLERAAEELGRFQGRCNRQASALRKIVCLGDAGYMRRDFAQWTPETAEYRWLRSGDCTLPPRAQRMLIDLRERSDIIFRRVRRLPQVLCHRDFWTENIFLSDGKIVLIDWDCAGWGFVGEDIASLIADETQASEIPVYCQRLLPAYCRGLWETMKIPPICTLPIREMILLKFGYRLLQQAMFARSPEPKEQAILALEEIDALW